MASKISHLNQHRTWTTWAMFWTRRFGKTLQRLQTPPIALSAIQRSLACLSTLVIPFTSTSLDCITTGNSGSDPMSSSPTASTHHTRSLWLQAAPSVTQWVSFPLMEENAFASVRPSQRRYSKLPRLLWARPSKYLLLRKRSTRMITCLWLWSTRLTTRSFQSYLKRASSDF